jgi:hypothetical protein
MQTTIHADEMIEISPAYAIHILPPTMPMPGHCTVANLDAPYLTIFGSHEGPIQIPHRAYATFEYDDGKWTRVPNKSLF